MAIAEKYRKVALFGIGTIGAGLAAYFALKGIVKKLKELYPHSNVVAIDYDPSASRVNQLNRIKLMLEVAKENL